MEANNQLMQSLENQQTHHEAQERTISIELLAYIFLALLAIIFRIAELDTVPLTDYEAQQALHAWHTVTPSAPGSYSVTSSPINYVFQLVTFSTLGGSEVSVRLGALIAGVLLSLSPILFRERIGKTRAFVWSVLLSLLTVPVVSSRYADGTTWMMLFTVLSIWAIWRYWYTEKLSDAMWATAFVTLMVLLSSPSGIPLFIMLLVAGWLAVWRTALSAPERLELTGDDILQTALKRLMSFPYLKVAFIPVFVTVAISTMLMFNPAGLSTVSQLIESAFRGVVQPAQSSGVRLGFLALLTYEPLLIIFAVGGAWLLWRHGDLTYVDRFAVAWAIVGTIGLLLYVGATASDAMWVVVPLTLLASYGITELMTNRRIIILWTTSSSDENELYSTRYWWVKWIISLGVLLLLFVISVHFLEIARGFLLLPPQGTIGDLFTRLLEPVFNEFRYSLLWFVLAIVFGVVGFLLVASFWGNETTLQGVGLGFVLFLLISGMGGAWNTAVENGDSPVEIWHPNATTQDAYLLRDTLFEIAERDSSGFPMLKVNVVTDETNIIKNNGLVTWLLRDFPNANFVNSIDATQGEQIILMAETSANNPELGGDYVGQSFVLRRHWSPTQLAPLDIWAWWSQRRIRTEQLRSDISVLWLRQDVYNGIPVNERPR